MVGMTPALSTWAAERVILGFLFPLAFPDLSLSFWIFPHLSSQCFKRKIERGGFSSITSGGRCFYRVPMYCPWLHVLSIYLLLTYWRMSALNHEGHCCTLYSLQHIRIFTD